MERPVAKVELQTVESQTPIFAFDLSSRTFELEKAKLAVNELQISNPEKRTSNVYGEWLSPKNSHQLNPNLLPLCNLALDITNQVWVDIFSGGEGNFRKDIYPEYKAKRGVKPLSFYECRDFMIKKWKDKCENLEWEFENLYKNCVKTSN